MAILQIVFEIIVPVFGVVGTGYALARLKWIGAGVIEGLSAFAFRVALPIMLFRSMAVAELPEAFPTAFLLSYFLAAYGVFAVGFLIARRFGLGLAARGLFAFGSSYSNLVLIGIPLVLTAWGDAAVVPLFTIVALHAPLLFTPLIAVLEIDRGGGGFLKNVETAVRGIVRNQYVIGILLGLCYNLLGAPLPDAVDSLLGMFAVAAPPLALFCMGGSLSGLRIMGEIPVAFAITALKTLALPAFVWLLGSRVFGLDDLWLGVAVTVAAMPAGVNIYLFARQYGVGAPLATTTTLVSTAVSIVTLTVTLTLLGVR